MLVRQKYISAIDLLGSSGSGVVAEVVRGKANILNSVIETKSVRRFRPYEAKRYFSYEIVDLVKLWTLNWILWVRRNIHNQGKKMTWTPKIKPQITLISFNFKSKTIIDQHLQKTK